MTPRISEVYDPKGCMLGQGIANDSCAHSWLGMARVSRARHTSYRTVRTAEQRRRPQRAIGMIPICARHHSKSGSLGTMLTTHCPTDGTSLQAAGPCRNAKPFSLLRFAERSLHAGPSQLLVRPGSLRLRGLRRRFERRVVGSACTAPGSLIGRCRCTGWAPRQTPASRRPRTPASAARRRGMAQTSYGKSGGVQGSGLGSLKHPRIPPMLAGAGQMKSVRRTVCSRVRSCIEVRCSLKFGLIAQSTVRLARNQGTEAINSHPDAAVGAGPAVLAVLEDHGSVVVLEPREAAQTAVTLACSLLRIGYWPVLRLPRRQCFISAIADRHTFVSDALVSHDAEM